jgi:hypothetical protein
LELGGLRRAGKRLSRIEQRLYIDAVVHGYLCHGYLLGLAQVFIEDESGTRLEDNFKRRPRDIIFPAGASFNT